METASAPQRYPIDASADALQSAISGQISLRDDGAHPSRVSVAQLSSVSFLGTSSAQPVPGKRNMSSLVIATEAGSGIMVDFGKAHERCCIQCIKCFVLVSAASRFALLAASRKCFDLLAASR
jgi:hypothetical protein